MTYRPQTLIYQPRHFAPACSALIISTFFSIMAINLPGGTVSFILLPLLIIALWPRGVNGIISVITIFIIGLWMDWITNGALGQWEIIYLSVYAVIRPNRREQGLGFMGAVYVWFIALCVGWIAFIVTGWIAYQDLPNFISLFRQSLLISALLPIVILIRNLTRYVLTDADERDY